MRKLWSCIVVSGSELKNKKMEKRKNPFSIKVIYWLTQVIFWLFVLIFSWGHRA